MELKDIYESLYAQMKASSELKENYKETETTVREAYALASGFIKKKTNEPDTAKIQSATFKSALELHTKREEKNKLEESLSNQDTYMNDMKNELIPKSDVTKLVNVLEQIDENKENIKDIKKAGEKVYEKGIIKGIEDIIKIQLKNEKLLEESGESASAKESEYLKRLKELAKELNVNI